MTIKCFFNSICVASLISLPLTVAATDSWYSTEKIEYENANVQNSTVVEVVQQVYPEEIVTEIDYGEVVDPNEILEFYQVEVPEDIRVMCEKAGEESNVCPELLEAICWRESRFDPDAYNSGCCGLMQISVKWHTGRMEDLGVTDIYDAYSNIRVGADYLAELFEKHDGDLYAVLMEYNGDTSEGVSDYALEICEISEALERVHGK